VTILPSPVPHPLEQFPFDVPRWAHQAFEWVVGAGWPQGDENATWDVADRWYSLTRDLTGPHDAAYAAAQQIVAGYHGAGIAPDGFLDAWQRLSGDENAPLNALLQITQELGALVEECGRDIEAAKLEVWIELGIFLIELRGIALTSALTLGAAAPAAGGLIAATRIAVQQIFDRLAEQLGTKSIGTPATDQPRAAPGTRTVALQPTAQVSDRASRRDEHKTVRINPGSRTRRLHPPNPPASSPPTHTSPDHPPPAHPSPTATTLTSATHGHPMRDGETSVNGERGSAGDTGRPPASWNAFTEPSPAVGVRRPSETAPSPVERVHRAYAENQREDYLRYLATLADESRAKIRDLEWGAERAVQVGAAPRGVALRRQATQIVPIVAEIEDRIKLINSIDLAHGPAEPPPSRPDPNQDHPSRRGPGRALPSERGPGRALSSQRGSGRALPSQRGSDHDLAGAHGPGRRGLGWESVGPDDSSGDGRVRTDFNRDPADRVGPDGWARIGGDGSGVAASSLHSDEWSALTGGGGGRPIDQTRHYHVSGGLRRPSAVHQAALTEAMSAAGDGRTARLADPRVGDWFRLVNDGGPGADPTRGLNCLDVVLALFDTYLHARPRVAAARTFDGYAQGDADRAWGGEWDAFERVRLATGAAFQNLCPFVGAADPALAKPAVATAVSNLTNHLHNSGHGAYAFIVTDLEGGGCHAWAAVNQGGTILFLDPQVARISAEEPLYTHSGRPSHANVVSMDALVVDGQGVPAPLPYHGPGQWAQHSDQPETPPNRL
jgi:papain fold toxin 1 (glutamine deamidase) of polymorphic toxin system